MRERPYVVVPPGPGRLLWEVHTRDGLADMGVLDLERKPGVSYVRFAEPIQGPMMFHGVLDLDDDHELRQ